MNVEQFSECHRCGRALRNPKSREVGFGKICLAKTKAREADEKAGQPAALPFDGDLVFKMVGVEYLSNVPQQIVKHSPTGLSWGYLGSGCSDMALNALLLYTDQKTAEKLYMKFKFDFISKVPENGGTIKGDDVRAWLAAQTETGK